MDGEVVSRESGVNSQESGVRSQESGVRSQESGARSQESIVRAQFVFGIWNLLFGILLDLSLYHRHLQCDQGAAFMDLYIHFSVYNFQSFFHIMSLQQIMQVLHIYFFVVKLHGK